METLYVPTLRDQWNVYRSEDLHECNLFGLRINALLTSQTVLVAAVAFLFDKSTVLSFTVALLGLATCILSWTAIHQGCKVMDKWHERGRKMLEQDTQRELEGLHLGRNLPDKIHLWSLDHFATGLCVSFVIFWLAAIARILVKKFSDQ